MDGEPVPMRIPENDPGIIELRLAVRGGDLKTVGRLLAERPGLARATFAGRKGGRGPCCILPPTGPDTSPTALRWSGSWSARAPTPAPRRQARIRAGMLRGRCTARPAAMTSTWPPRCDAGADIEAPGGTIALGPPLANAVGYGCWHVARLLVARGARVGSLWEAAALGDRPRVEELLAVGTPRARNREQAS